MEPEHADVGITMKHLLILFLTVLLTGCVNIKPCVLINGLMQGHGVPATKPQVVAMPWVYYDLDGGSSYIWNVEKKVWQ